ncbi:hypothetical protein [Clostridium sp. VAP52]|uniref:hypothetical protein n=1 Tax=Clostridium sp. VAP52 TaxID=2949977 RepID=UPI00207A56B2|nr:hypothetical protein [Clostridium sp. VAP52]
MKTIQIKKSIFESYKKNLNLKQIDKNKYLYKKNLKYRIKKTLKVIGMVLFIPLLIPYCIGSIIFLSVVEIFKEMSSFTCDVSDLFKLLLFTIKDDFESIFDRIIEVEE